MKIGEKIKARRKELGMSADELGEKIGKHRATIYRYESLDVEKMDIELLVPLAKALDVSPDYLMGWENLSDIDVSEENEIEKIVTAATERGEVKDFFTTVIDMPPEDFETARKVIDALVKKEES